VYSRLSVAVIRDGTLWTCHHVGLDGADGEYNGDGAGSSVDRSAAQCLRLHISETGHLVLISSADLGRIWDQSASHPRWYYYPSLMVNSDHDVVLGFSGSSELSFVGAYYSWRRAGGTAMEGPVLIKAGEAYYDLNRWGDYSYTSLDPSDGLTIWTVQEYARPPVPPAPPYQERPAWGTWIARIIRQD
jgi:hypothetical protein